MTSLAASAQARIGLLGNPSDIYGGRGLGFSVRELGVTVTLATASSTGVPNERRGQGYGTMARFCLARRGAIRRDS